MRCTARARWLESIKALCRNLSDTQNDPYFVSLGSRGFLGLKLGGKRADRARAVLEAEGRATIFSHAQFDKRVDGKWIGFWRWMFLGCLIKAECMAHIGFGDSCIDQARYLQRLR